MFSPDENQREHFRALLENIGKLHMPFGKFGPAAYPPHGVPMIDLPIEYLVWFKERGFPKGHLGAMMEQVYEIKAAGMDQIFNPLRTAAGGRFPLRPTRIKRREFE